MKIMEHLVIIILIYDRLKLICAIENIKDCIDKYLYSLPPTIIYYHELQQVVTSEKKTIQKDLKTLKIINYD